MSSVYGEDPALISLLDLLASIQGVGGDFNTLIGDAQTTRFVGGPQQLSKGLAKKLTGSILLGQEVVGIERGHERVTVVTRGDAFVGRRAILTPPSPVLDTLRYRPALPPAYDQLLQRQPMGAVTKVNAIYDEPFWRADGLNGSVVSDTGPIRVVFDNSPPGGRPGVLVGFFEGNASRAAFGSTPAQRRSAALDCFERYFGARARSPIGLPRHGLGGGAVHARGVRQLQPAGGDHRARPGHRRARRPAALRRRRHIGAMARVHGRRDTLGRTRRARGIGGAVSVSKAVLITGCSTGIGRATAERLAARGWTVYATARRKESVADLEAKGCRTLALDVCDEDSMQAAVKAVEDEHGAVGALVNNAGYSQSGAVETIPPAELRRQFETNVFGLVRMCQLVLPGMRRQRHGRIVNLSSMGGRLVFPGGGAYHGTKYAVEALSDALRFEVAGFGIDVVLIEPGLIKTDFGQTAAGSVGDTELDGPYGGFNTAVAATTASAYEGPMSRLGAGPGAVARVIEKAISRRRPRTRYPVTGSARAAARAPRRPAGSGLGSRGRLELPPPGREVGRARTGTPPSAAVSVRQDANAAEDRDAGGGTARGGCARGDGGPSRKLALRPRRPRRPPPSRTSSSSSPTTWRGTSCSTCRTSRQLQRDGMTFSHYFVTDSLCCPSRSSIFTGRFPHDTGVFTNMAPTAASRRFHARGEERARSPPRCRPRATARR